MRTSDKREWRLLKACQLHRGNERALLVIYKDSFLVLGGFSACIISYLNRILISTSVSVQILTAKPEVKLNSPLFHS